MNKSYNIPPIWNNNCNCIPRCNCQCNNAPSEEILLNLGQYFYDILSEVEFPCGYPDLNTFIMYALCGFLPPCHPTLLQIACLTLNDKI